MKREAFIAQLTDMLDDIQNQLFQRACRFRDEHTRNVDDRNDFYDWFTPKKPGQTGDPWRFCHVSLVWGRGLRSQNQSGSQRHHPLYPVTCATGDGGLYLLRKA